MLWLELLPHVLHILGAISLAGGAIFWRFVGLPAMEGLSEDVRREVGGAIRARWAKVVMSASGTLLISGLINFMMIIQRFELDKSEFPGSKYHMLFGIKFLLALIAFTLAALLSGRTSLAERLRQNQRFWLNVNVVLAMVLVLLGALLGAAGRHPKSAQSSRSATTSPELSPIGGLSAVAAARFE